MTKKNHDNKHKNITGKNPFIEHVSSTLPTHIWLIKVKLKSTYSCPLLLYYSVWFMVPRLRHISRDHYAYEIHRQYHSERKINKRKMSPNRDSPELIWPTPFFSYYYYYYLIRDVGYAFLYTHFRPATVAVALAGRIFISVLCRVHNLFTC